MPSIAVTGADQLRAVAASLKLAGSPAKGIRSKLRRNLRAAAEPIKAAVKENVLAIPVKGPASTGLRAAIAANTKIRTNITGRNALVRVLVDQSKMPAGQRTLPAYLEGLGRWRHPVFGERGLWVGQESHPYFAPAVAAHLAAVQAAALEAIDETALEIERGI